MMTTQAAPSIQGVQVYRDAVPPALVEAALRCIHLDIWEWGLSRRELLWWKQMTPFPHLRESEPILAIRRRVAAVFDIGPEHTPCEPQILAAWPDAAEDWPLVSHLDQEPPWANGRRYSHIIGVAFTDWDERSGTIHVWQGGVPVPIVLRAGDAFAMSPTLEHATGLNRSGQIRWGVYFRWLG